MTAAPEVRALASRIARTEAASKQRGEQLAYSALEDGALREFSTDSGAAVQVAQYGKQFDGTSTAAVLVSPPPPAPSTPTVTSVAGGLKVKWDGTFLNDITIIAPMDWRQVDVVCGPTGMDPIARPPALAITSPRGGEVFVPLVDGTYDVALVSRTLAGRPSAPSASVPGTALPLVDSAIFDEALVDLGDARTRIATAEQDVTNALANALTADNKAVAAQNTADAANSLATLAKAKADGSITVYRQASAPATALETNDLWIDSDDGLLYVWTGSWTLSADQRIATVVASNATKTTVFAQASPPPTTGRTIGDLWIDTDYGNKIFDWSGSWTERLIGSGAVAFTASDIGGSPRIVAGVGNTKTFYNVLSWGTVGNSANLPGFVVINTPITFGNYMFTIRIKGYNYFQGSADIDLTVSGYTFATSSSVLQMGANNTGSAAISARFAKAANGTLAIILKSEAPAPNANLWQYPRIAVSEAQIGYTLAPDSWVAGWSAGMLADEAAVTAAYTNLLTPPVYDAGAAAASANALATLAKSTADSKITVYRQSSAPTGTFKVNDLWLDSDDGLVYYASTTAGAWLLHSDQRIAAVVTSNAAKTTVFAQTSQPSTSGRTIGDIWIDTDDGNKIYDWSGSWTVRLIGAPAISATARELGAVTIYRQSTAPATGMITNDLWVDSDDGLLYVYAGSWLLSADQRIASVVASDAIKVTLFAQTTAPTSTGRVTGDMWLDTDDNDKLYRWAGSWVLTDLTSVAYIGSRSTNLITNGTGALGNNRNFSLFALDKSDAPEGAAGSFDSTLGVSSTLTLDELLPVDPTKKFKLSFLAKQKGTTAGGYLYAFVQPFDAFQQVIDPGHNMYVAGTLTTLAVALNPGDTTMTINTPPTPWYGSAGKAAGASVQLRRAIFWDYVDPGGRLWPELTYSRNNLAPNAWADGGITGNVITLSAPYAGPAKPAGTKLSNGSSGGTYMYGGAVNTLVPKAWTAYAATVSGTTYSGGGSSMATGWPPGVGYAKLGFLVNRTVTGPPDAASKHSIALVSFGDAQAAQDAADAKAMVYRQASAPATASLNDLWFDTDDGKVYVYNAGWQLSDDQRIGQALTSAANAQASAEKADALNLNPSFSAWAGAAGTAPDNWTIYTTAPTKETALARTPPYAARFNCTDATTVRGLYQGSAQVPMALGLQYVTVSVDIMLNSGTTFGGSGLLLDWTGMTGGNRAVVNFSAEVPAPVVGSWYRIQKVVQRPATAVGTHTSWLTYLMGQYSAGMGAQSVKDIVINRYAMRPSTAEEISAFNSASAASVSSLTTTVNNKTAVFVQTSAPSTVNRTIGDLWLDSDDGNKPYDWTGAWTARQFGNSALANLDLSKLTVVGGANVNDLVAQTMSVKIANFIQITANNITAGAIDGISMTGATIRTAASGSRWEMSSGWQSTLRSYSGLAGEVAPGGLVADPTNNGAVTIQGSDMGSGKAFLHVGTDDAVLGGILTQVNQVWTSSDVALFLANARTLIGGGSSQIDIKDGKADGSEPSISLDGVHGIDITGNDVVISGQDYPAGKGSTATLQPTGLFLEQHDSAGSSEVNMSPTTVSLLSVPNVGATVSLDVGTAGIKASQPMSLATGGGWVTPVLGNSWVAYGATFGPPQYRKTLDGSIELRGLMKSGTLGTTIFTLPAGFRPAYDELFTTLANAGAGTARVDVLTSGIVKVTSYGTSATNGYVSLSGIRFSPV